MNILVIDDDPNIRMILSEVLTAEGHNVFSSEDGIAGMDYFLKEKVDVCFLDLWMPKIGGIDLLKKIKEEYPDVEIIMISGQAKINLAVKATKMGAYDFIEKPLSISSVVDIIKSLENQEKGRNSYKTIIADKELLIGKSRQIENIRKLIENSSNSDVRIFITGENGTGKEIIAREIHARSARANKPFIGVNCAAIPENLIESELFGYTKGAFTGAYFDKMGKFEAANYGTLFLDEVGDMSITIQAKVLRVLQEMKVTRIGSTSAIKIDVRIIAATNKNLKEEIKNGRFREDLYYRLNVIPFNIPPLRERKEDIPLFVEYYMKFFSKYNNDKKKELMPDALEFLISYSWPGNVRQLRNIIERLNIMISEELITVEDVKKHLDADAIQILTGSLIENKYENYKLNEARIEFEKDLIEKKLIENDFNLSKTSKMLGVYTSNLYSKINKLGINIEKLKEMYYNK